MTAHETEQLDVIWSAAKKRYADITGEEMDDKTFPHPNTTEDLIVSLDYQNDKFKHFREKKGMIFAILRGACKPIELASNVAGGAASAAFPPSTLCFGAAVYLIKAADGVSASYEAIIDLLGTLKDFLIRLQIYDREDLTIELRTKFAEILAILLEVFARSTKLIRGGFGGRILKFSKNILLGGDEKLQGLVAKLQKLTLSESQLVGAEIFTETKSTGRKMDGISVTLTETSMAVQEGNEAIHGVSLDVHQISINQDEFRREMRQEIGNVVAVLNLSKGEAADERDPKRLHNLKTVLQPSVSPLDTYMDISKNRVQGTGDWVRNELLFQLWYQQKNPVLYVSGNPGSGKSYLSGNIISYLQEQHPQGVQHTSRTSVGYFFFKDNNPKTRSLLQALKDLAYQISQNDPVYAKHVISQCQSPEDVSTIPSAWRKLFVDFFIRNEKIDSSVYLVVDGVDEAYDTELQLFLSFLSDVKEAASNGARRSRIHLVMIGRPQIIDNINEALEVPVPTIHVDLRKNSEDIINYIQTSIRKSKVLSRVPKQLQNEIVETLGQNAQGMFMWVDLMMRELGKKTRPASMRDALQKAPKGLPQMLRHVLEGFSATLKDEDPDDLNTMLAWVTCAAQPLVLGQLDTILKLKSPEGEGVFFLEGKLRKQFASFFTLIRQDGLSTADLQNDVLATYLGEIPDAIEEGEGLDDVENETDFDSDPLTTDVVFCHASIGDFFRDEAEGKVVVGNEGPAVGVGIVEARVDVLRVCLRLICDPELSSKVQDSLSMQPYALDFWHQHLEEAIEYSGKINNNVKQEIGALLVKMLRDEAIVPLWSGQSSYMFFNYEKLEPIRRWIGEESVVASLPAADQEWVRSISRNAPEIFFPAGVRIAKEWLQDVRWEAVACIGSVYAIKSSIAGEPVKVLPDPMPLQHILDTANWLHFEPTALWHRRLAMVLREYQHYDESMEHFETALRLDETMWTARSGMARWYALRNEYEKAIELEKTNENIIKNVLENVGSCVIEDTDIEDLHDCCQIIGEWYGMLKDFNKSLEYYRKSFAYSKYEYSDAVGCIRILATELGDPRQEDIITILHSVNDEIPDKGCTRLTEIINEYKWPDGHFFKACASAAQATGQLVWLQDVYLAAIGTARRKRKTVLALSLGVCLGELYLATGEEEKAARLWERIIKAATIAGAAGSWEIKYCKDLVVKPFSKYCLQKAFDFGKGTSEANTYVRKIEQVCKQKVKGTTDALEVITTNYSAIFLGLWYRLNGQTEEAQACFQPYIKEALIILSDDDPDNDNVGYYDLAHVLIAAGDEANAIAVLQMLQPLRPPIQEVKEKKKPDEETTQNTTGEQKLDMALKDEENEPNDERRETKDGGEESTDKRDEHQEIPDNQSTSPPCAWYCDGPCSRGFPTFINGNICRYCLADLCSDCLLIVKSKATKYPKVCNPTHDWQYVPEPTVQPPGKNQLILGGEVVGLEDLVSRFHKEWRV